MNRQRVSGPGRHWQSYRSKRMECDRLAGAVGGRKVMLGSKAPASRAHSIRFAPNRAGLVQGAEFGVCDRD